LDIIEKGYPLNLSRFILNIPQEVVESIIRHTNFLLLNRNNEVIIPPQSNPINLESVHMDHSKESEEFLNVGCACSESQTFSLKFSITLDDRACQILQQRTQQQREAIFDQIAQQLHLEKHYVRSVLIKEWKIKALTTNSNQWLIPKKIGI
jgi:hypothetical protein